MALLETPPLEPIEDAKPADDDQRLWSVTTIIGALDKPALLWWARQKVAEAAVAETDVWQAIASKRPSEAVKWLMDAPYRRAEGERSATDLGNAAHAAFEEYVITGVKPDVDDEVRPFLDQFDGWCQQFQPAYEAAEVTVYNPSYGYAGTADAFLTVDGVRFLADYKTSRDTYDKRGKLRTPYPEQVGLQLAAYRHAEFAAAWRPRRFEKWRRRYYLLGPAEVGAGVPIPEVDYGLVIQVTPESCHAYPIECGPAVFEAFLHVEEAFRWVQETSKVVMGDALTPVRAVA